MRQLAALGAALVIAGLPSCAARDHVEPTAPPYPIFPGTLGPDEQPAEQATGQRNRSAGSTPDTPAAVATASARRSGAPAAPAARTFRAVGGASDASSDHGIEGPGYADLTRVTIQDNGRRARIMVDLAEEMPRWPAVGEVIGIGVDLWRDASGEESDYQLFAEGGESEWNAHLQTPRGLVTYPGELRLGGRRLVFEVAWSDLGNLTSGRFSAFADWSKRRVGLNAASYDSAPDDGRSAFHR